MKNVLTFSAACIGAALLAACSGGSVVPSQVPVAGADAPIAGTMSVRQATTLGYVQAICPRVPGRPRCLAYKVTNAGLVGLGYAAAVSSATASPVPGYGPADLQSAYKFSPTSGSGKTVAVVEEGDYPSLAADLAVYRSHFGLTSCTVSSGCLRVVNQNGTSSLPPTDLSWAQETALDVDVVSAVCPKCKILVVEANEDFTFENEEINLATAENTAARLGAAAISNSYGTEETADELQAFAPAYKHSGVAITAATGDSGINSVQPAVFASVIAVGGTTLSRAPGTSRGWTEGAWSGATGFCAQVDPGVAEPSWQTRHGVNVCNGLRAAGDVAFDADTNTGIAVYNQGWSVMGGTSVGAPAIASFYALAGTGRDTPSSMYTKSSDLFDITGPSVSGCSSIICQAGPGWDGPTGNGTPNGLSAFY